MRIGQPRQQQADAEDEAGEQGVVQRHEKAWRTRQTVTKPVAMKAMVAMIERGERRDRPQMPWPLVQPEP